MGMDTDDFSGGVTGVSGSKGGSGADMLGQLSTPRIGRGSAMDTSGYMDTDTTMDKVPYMRKDM